MAIPATDRADTTATTEDDDPGIAGLGTAVQLEWVRRFYGDLFAESGGGPVPGEAYEGALVNHPDVDLADPALNASGVPWSALYFGENYPRLQAVKARWDPLNVFRHALSVRANDAPAV